MSVLTGPLAVHARAVQRLWMTSTVALSRPVPPVLDEETGDLVPQPPQPLAVLPCSLHPLSAADMRHMEGDPAPDVAQMRWVLRVPLQPPGFAQAGDHATVSGVTYVVADCPMDSTDATVTV